VGGGWGGWGGGVGGWGGGGGVLKKRVEIDENAVRGPTTFRSKNEEEEKRKGMWKRGESQLLATGMSGGY